jgi:large subunit ribosomal protein L22
MDRSKANTKFIRIPPRKARLAANLIRGLQVEHAATQLAFCNMKAGRLLKKTLDSAIANAEMNWDARRDQLFVLEVRVDEGPRLKRAKSKSRGGRAPIIKRMSHFTVVVGEKEAKEQ